MWKILTIQLQGCVPRLPCFKIFALILFIKREQINAIAWKYRLFFTRRTKLREIFKRWCWVLAYLKNKEWQKFCNIANQDVHFSTDIQFLCNDYITGKDRCGFVCWILENFSIFLSIHDKTPWHIIELSKLSQGL